MFELDKAIATERQKIALDSCLDIQVYCMNSVGSTQIYMYLLSQAGVTTFLCMAGFSSFFRLRLHVCTRTKADVQLIIVSVVYPSA